jgi:1-acyl-sn-glycerol-3-phosphate acyltransferase
LLILLILFTLVKELLYRLVAICYITFVFVTSFCFFLVACVIWLLTVLFDPNLRALHRFTCHWASLYIWAFPPWSVTVNGRDKINPKLTYVIVSNHQSLVDILAAFCLFTHFKWVSKSELFDIPLIGWNMYLNRYVKLERGRTHSVRKMYAACEKHLKNGSSIFVFPEGTRSTTGKLREFKEGAFVLAKRLNVPILPLVINGSKNALPKDSLNFHGRSDVQVTILDPILPDAFGDMDTSQLTTMVRERIRVHVAEEVTLPGG